METFFMVASHVFSLYLPPSLPLSLISLSFLSLPLSLSLPSLFHLSNLRIHLSIYHLSIYLYVTIIHHMFAIKMNESLH